MINPLRLYPEELSDSDDNLIRNVAQASQSERSLFDFARWRRVFTGQVNVMSAFRTARTYRSIGNRTIYRRHLYGDAADIFVDADGDGPMDDLNGDGVPEILVGGATPFHHGTKAGYAAVYAGRCLGSATEYGAGTPGRGGFVPDLGAAGCPSPTARFELSIEDGRGGTFFPSMPQAGAGGCPKPFRSKHPLDSQPFELNATGTKFPTRCA